MTRILSIIVLLGLCFASVFSVFSPVLRAVYHEIFILLSDSLTYAVGFIIIVLFLNAAHRVIKVKSFRVVEISYTQIDQTPSFIEYFLAQNNIRVLDQDLQVQSSNKERLYTNIYSLIIPNDISLSFISDSLSSNQDIKRIRFRNNV